MAPFKFRIRLNGCPAPGTLSEEILSRFFLAGGGRGVPEGYVGRYVEGMSEGMSEGCAKGMGMSE